MSSYSTLFLNCLSCCSFLIISDFKWVFEYLQIINKKNDCIYTPTYVDAILAPVFEEFTLSSKCEVNRYFLWCSLEMKLMQYIFKHSSHFVLSITWWDLGLWVILLLGNETRAPVGLSERVGCHLAARNGKMYKWKAYYINLLRILICMLISSKRNGKYTKTSINYLQFFGLWLRHLEYV